MKHHYVHEEAKPKAIRWKEIIKIGTKINKLETKKLYKESMKPKVHYLKW
jgi:hypothetical protein